MVMANPVVVLDPGTTLRLAGGSVVRGTYVATAGCRLLGPAGPGSAPPPVISGALPVPGPWTAGPGGSLVAALPPGCERPTQLFVGGRRMTPARHPNGDASLRINRDAPKGASLLSLDAKPTAAWVGATAHVRTTRFTYEAAVVQGIGGSGGPVLRLAPPLQFGAKVGYGAYLSGLAVFLDAPEEWWADPGAGHLYFIPPSGTMPPSEAFELSCFSAGVVVQSGASGVTISGVAFSRQTADGIVVHSGASNVTVNRCDFEGQGGHGLHALAAVAVTVRHSSFRHILGRGVYANGTRQLEVSDNNLSHIGLHPGQGVSGVNGMSGIVLHSNVRGAIITDNVVTDVGYIGIRTAAMGVIANHNVVLRSCLMLDDCAALYAGWGPDSRDIRLHHNFLAVAPGNRRHTPHGRHAALSHGIYLDDRSSNIDVAFNVIVNMGGAGINVHNAHSNVLRGNVLVGNEGPQVALDEGDAPACVQCGRAKRRYFARSDPIDIDVAELVPLPRKGRPSDFKQLCHILRGTGRCAPSPAHFQKV
eukprot:EG_transcript_3138